MMIRCMITARECQLRIYVDRFTVAFKRTPTPPPYRTSHYNFNGWFVCCLQSTTIKRCLLVQSIQPSHPGALASIFTIFCTAQNAKGIHMTANKKQNGVLVHRPKISVGLSSQPQDRYIVARRPPRSMARRLPSAVCFGTFQGVPSAMTHDVN